MPKHIASAFHKLRLLSLISKISKKKKKKKILKLAKKKKKKKKSLKLAKKKKDWRRAFRWQITQELYSLHHIALTRSVNAVKIKKLGHIIKVKILKMKHIGFAVIRPKDVDGLPNSVDPDQTAPKGAI